MKKIFLSGIYTIFTRQLNEVQPIKYLNPFSIIGQIQLFFFKLSTKDFNIEICISSDVDIAFYIRGVIKSS